MIDYLRLRKYKSWEDTKSIKLKPITGFFGPNSSGKTSLIQSILLMKQTVESPDRVFLLNFGDEETLVDLGDFQSIIHKHDRKSALRVAIGWQSGEEFDIPSSFGSGSVEFDEAIRFEFEIKERGTSVEQALTLEWMNYAVAGRRFGMRHIPIRQAYRVFASGEGADLSRIARYVRRRRQDGLSALRPWKFYEFPSWAARILGEEEFPSDLETTVETLFEDVFYLGPFRAYPQRIYRRSASQPIDIGISGERAVDALLFPNRKVVRLKGNAGLSGVTAESFVAEWLRRLGLAFDFRVEQLTEGKPVFEVKIRKTSDAAEVLLTDVGFGVSQVLPVLVLCSYVPVMSTVILEQPEVHLHPSAQAELADLFIDAFVGRKVQVIFESHSEHLLRRLQRRIAEEKVSEDDIGLFFCSIDEEGRSSIEQLKLDQYGNIANWPKDFFGDQFGEMAAMSEASINRQIRFEET